MLTAITQGFLLALGLILPLGVQNTFVLQQGVIHPRLRRGIPVVVTAALCDTLLIVVAVLGVSVVVLQVTWFKAVISWLGIAFLAYMGWVTWRTGASNGPNREAAQWPVKRQVLFSATVSLLNPHAIMDTVGIIGTTALRFEGPERWAYTITCIVVSWLWFITLLVVGRLLGATGDQWKVWLNKASAVIMWGVGLQLLWSMR